MSAIAEPADKKSPEFKKSPVKYHYRLKAGIKAKSSEWTGGQGKVLSVLSSVAYLTARDVANQLRIEPHVAQGLLQRLLIRGAVERRIIPGSIHDEATKVAAKGPTPEQERIQKSYCGEVKAFDKEIVAGSIVKHRNVCAGAVVVERVNDFCLDVYCEGHTGPKRQHYQVPYAVTHVGQTPNPIAFNQGRYSECFSAPVIEEVKELKTADGFVVGDIVVFGHSKDHERILEVFEDGNALVQAVNDPEHKWETSALSEPGWWKLVRRGNEHVKVEPSKNPLVEAISEKVDEATRPQPKFKVGDRVEVIGNKYFGDGTIERVNVPPFGHYRVRHDNGRGDEIIHEHNNDGCGGWAESSLRAIDRPAPQRFHVARPELLPNDALSEVSKVFGLGADKYARDDWAKPDNGGGDHIEAAIRHLNKHRYGQRLEVGESGSGLPHLYHAAARLLMAIGKEMRNK